MEHLLSPGIMHWLMQYGYIALFFLLALGIVFLPIPEETLMVFAGYLIAKGKWPLVPTVIATVGGSITGITVSYLLGYTAGSYLLRKYGHIFGITEEKIAAVHKWFSKVGKWALFIGYFIMGMRHLTGYIAGTARLPYQTFALFAYSGGIIWSFSFLSIGYFFSNKLEELIEALDYDLLILASIGILFFYFIYRISKYYK